ncbi:MAG: hypothetical protein SGJ20_05230 [Planctomycetota bacterium]|nr:hypothetical protein [Planctomycetota bacterium]
MGFPAGQSPGFLSTIDQVVGPPLGDQYTAIEYTDFLNFIPDINTSIASFSINGLFLSGPAILAGPLVVQEYSGGMFSLYDPADNLLLQGPLTDSVLSGLLGPPGTGALFTATFAMVTGGSLLPYLDPNSVSLSMNMTNVNGGNGFALAGPQLDQFLADASINIAAEVVPEPSTLVLGLAASATFGITCLRSVRRRTRALA